MPSRSATHSTVRSSGVGPSPPVVMMVRAPRSTALRSASTIVARSSPMIVTLATASPSSETCWASQKLFVSWMRPIRSSVPILKISTGDLVISALPEAGRLTFGGQRLERRRSCRGRDGRLTAGIEYTAEHAEHTERGAADEGKLDAQTLAERADHEAAERRGAREEERVETHDSAA